jgi:hypothetical protein
MISRRQVLTGKRWLFMLSEMQLAATLPCWVLKLGKRPSVACRPLQAAQHLPPPPIIHGAEQAGCVIEGSPELTADRLSLWARNRLPVAHVTSRALQEDVCVEQLHLRSVRLNSGVMEILQRLLVVLRVAAGPVKVSAFQEPRTV